MSDWLVLFFVIIIAVAVLAALYFKHVRKYTCFGNHEGSYDGSHEGAGQPEVFYHGSQYKYSKLETFPNTLTTVPVVFGTPSYEDAVIFSAGLSDYETAMWGDGKNRYLEEQFPGAFESLKKTGYIHHLKGDFVPLKELAATSHEGLSNEFVCAKSVVPHKVDEVNIYEYLKGSNVIMRDYAEVRDCRAKAKKYVVKDKLPSIALCLHMPDEIRFNDKKFLEDLGSGLGSGSGSGPDYGIVHSWEMDNLDDASKISIFIGDTVLGNDEFIISRDHIYMRIDLAEAVAHHGGKTPPAQYYKYLQAKQNLCHDMEWMSPGQIINYIKNYINPQIMLRKKYPDCKITHVMGPSGSGKSTLCAELVSAGIFAIDSDTLTDKITGDPAQGYQNVYSELGGLMSQHKEIVVCGMTIPLGYLADIRYFIDLSHEENYKRLVNRTLKSICSADINFTGTSVDELEKEYADMSTKYQIRFPGFIPPGQFVANDAIPLRENYTRKGYIMMPYDEIKRALAG